MALLGSRKNTPAPLAAGATSKRTTPPLTGSTGLLAVTLTARLANAAPMFAVCGVLPATGVSVKPWLSKAPMSGAPTRPWPR